MEDDKIIVSIKSLNDVTLEYKKCNLKVNAFIGKNGCTYNKTEGDGKTPLGEFSLGLFLGTHKKSNNPNYNYMQINDEMYWVDDSKSKYYNQLVCINSVQKDWNSAEHLIDYPIQYEYLVEIIANPNNIPYKGSAIFLHCSNNNFTQGCVAVNKDAMEKIVNNISEKTKIIIKYA